MDYLLDMFELLYLANIWFELVFKTFFALLKVWEASEAYQEYLGFIIAIGEAVKDRKLTETVSMSPGCQRLVQMLHKLKKTIGEHTPQEMQARYRKTRLSYCSSLFCAPLVDTVTPPTETGAAAWSRRWTPCWRNSCQSSPEELV